MAIDEAVSLPALAAMLRQAESTLRQARHAGRMGDGSHNQMLMGASRTLIAPMYQVQPGSIQKEADSANHVIRQVTDRLYRLGAAYGEWEEFDVEAYFCSIAYFVTKGARFTWEITETLRKYYFIAG